MEPRGWPTRKDELINHGHSNIEILVKHYKAFLLKVGFDPEASEWSDEWSELLLSVFNQSAEKLNTLSCFKLWPQLLALHNMQML